MTATSFRSPAGRWALSPTRPRDLLLAAGLVALALWLGWNCLTVAMAGGLAVDTPDAALRWRPNDAAALAGVAEDRFEQARTPADLDAAADLARRALRRAPLSTAPLRVLGLIAQRQGRIEDARALMAIAGQRSHRDLLTQAWLFDDARVRDDDAAAFERADAMLRREDGMDKSLFPSMIETARDPAATAPLVQHLAAGTTWRTAFLSALASTGDPDAAFRVLSGLKRTALPPTDEEAGFLVARLIRDGDYRRAYATWMALLPAGAAAHPGGLYDGDFAPRPGAEPFNWRLNPNTGIIAERAQPPSGPAASALHVQFLPTTPADLADQILLLAPGDYRLTGQVMFETPVDQGEFRWLASCADGDHRQLAEASQAGSPQQWRAFSMTFTVPAACSAQRLQLAGRAGDGFDAVEAWYANLALQRLKPGEGARQ